MFYTENPERDAERYYDWAEADSLKAEPYLDEAAKYLGDEATEQEIFNHALKVADSYIAMWGH
jgi:hypothetical protein